MKCYSSVIPDNRLDEENEKMGAFRMANFIYIRVCVGDVTTRNKSTAIVHIPSYMHIVRSGAEKTSILIAINAREMKLNTLKMCNFSFPYNLRLLFL